jgi:hypothetical protein
MSRSGVVISSLAVPHPGGGRYVWVPAPTSTQAAANNTLTAVPVFLPPGWIDRLCCEVTAAGSAGSVVRLGAYKFNPTGFPVGALLADGGTVDATTIGAKEVTVSIYHPGGLIFLAGVAQGGPTTNPTLRIFSQPQYVPHGSLTSASTRNCWQGGASGALPDPYPTTATLQGAGIYVWVRYA